MGVKEAVSAGAHGVTTLSERKAGADRLIYLEELERLAELKDKGIVTEEEFTEKKHQILGI